MIPTPSGVRPARVRLQRTAALAPLGGLRTGRAAAQGPGPTRGQATGGRRPFLGHDGRPGAGHPAPGRHGRPRAALRLLLPDLSPGRVDGGAGGDPCWADILRYTISPIFGWLTMPLTKRVMVAPAPVTARFKAEYSNAMALRPSQIRATCVDGTWMVPSAMSLQSHYGALTLPVTIMAGTGTNRQPPLGRTAAHGGPWQYPADRRRPPGQTERGVDHPLAPCWRCRGCHRC